MLNRWVLAVLLCSGGAWAADAPSALQARDINNDGTADAFYDPVANLSWLADANYAATLGDWRGAPYLPGQIDFATATHMAATLNVYGVTGWRLPRSSVEGCGNDFTQYCDVDGFSELHTPTDGIRNVAGGLYWTVNPDSVFWTFSTFGPGTLLFLTRSLERGGDLYFAEFVHDGDVAVVPEPTTTALMLLGLGAVGLTMQRRPHH